MSEAKEKFYNIFKTAHSLTGDDLANIHNYISGLESEKAELIELVNSMLIFIPVDALEIYFSDKEVELIKQIQAEVKSQKGD